MCVYIVIVIDIAILVDSVHQSMNLDEVFTYNHIWL